MKVFHATTLVVDAPLVSVGRPKLDFGQGFYLTDVEEQARMWTARIAMRKKGIPMVNVYNLDKERALKRYAYKLFPTYSLDWLEFIVDNRKGGMSWHDYDLIEGGMADDRVIDTVEAYMAGFMPVEEALRRLAFHQPNNQLCITRQALIDECLEYVKTDKL